MMVRMRKCKYKELILLAAALLVVMLIAVFSGCSKVGCADARPADNDGLELLAEAARKAEYVVGGKQDWDRGEDLHVEQSLTEANPWFSQTHVQLGFSTDTVSVSKQGTKKRSCFGLKTKLAQSVMEESNSLYIPLGRSKTGEYVYALPRVKFWFQ